MAILAEVLKARRLVKQESLYMAQDGLLEGRFLGYLPNSRECEFETPDGEVWEYRMGMGMPNVNSLLGDKHFIRLAEGEIVEMIASVESQIVAQQGD